MNLMQLRTLIGSIPGDPNRMLPIGITNPHSWRGSYDLLAFAPTMNVSVIDMLNSIHEAEGATYRGWKGGAYTMSKHTEVHIDYKGEWSGGKTGAQLLKDIMENIEEYLT